MMRTTTVSGVDRKGVQSKTTKQDGRILVEKISVRLEELGGVLKKAGRDPLLVDEVPVKNSEENPREVGY